MSVLAQHIDSPDDRHRMVLLDATRLRCHDCQRTLVLPSTASPSGPTSTSSFDHPRQEQDRCPKHRAEWRHACRCCASEAKAATAPRNPPERNPPNVPEWDALRHRFPPPVTK